MIKLEYFSREDIPQLMEWIGDRPQFLLQWSGLSMKHPLTVDQLLRYSENANSADSDVLAFKVIHLESGKPIGHISLGSMNRENGTARMCRVLIGESKMKGKGIGLLMVKELLKIAFDQVKLHKVSLAVFDFNVSAIKLYEKAGFTTEGFIREACRIGEEYWSYYEMSILEHEWQAGEC
jgi:RimJ/RimL family protein N-acetyltransferase